MHLAIPALKVLHTAWKKRLWHTSPHLTPALESGMAKLESYYDKTEKSDAYLMAMGISHTATPFALSTELFQ